MSATSSEARTASAGGRDLSGPEHAKLVERAGHGAHRSGRDLGVEGGVVQLRVPEQDLDDADINAVLEQVGGKTVPQRVRPDPLGDLRGPCRLDDDAMKVAGADRPGGLLAREQPTVAVHHPLLPSKLPPLAQQGEQIGWQYGIAIPATLAALDPKQHALAVDVGDLERRDLGHAQARAIGHRERRLMLQAGGRGEQARHLLAAQHDGQGARVRHPDQPARQVRPVDRIGEEEPQRRHDAVHGRRRHAGILLFNLEPAQVISRRPIR
jgi:hypothetical protein